MEVEVMKQEPTARGTDDNAEIAFNEDVVRPIGFPIKVIGLSFLTFEYGEITTQETYCRVLDSLNTIGFIQPLSRISFISIV